jgi:glycosyltransferase A (GT-A) superfamily protein (DUF2064 family)
MEDLVFEGFDSICLMGSDSPTIPSSYVCQGVEYLTRSRGAVVIGPAVDGGYYFIGLKRACRRLFEEIDWGTNRVFEQTRMRVAELDMAQMMLPVWYDVDDGAALERLLEEVCVEECEKKETCAHRAIHMQRFLNSILLAEGTARIWPGRRVRH